MSPLARELLAYWGCVLIVVLSFILLALVLRFGFHLGCGAFC